MRSKMARLVASFAVAIAGSLAWAAPASAADSFGCTTYGCFFGEGWGSGYGLWMQNGDVMRVCDTFPDDLSVVIIATINGVNAPYKWHTAGAHTCTDRSYGNLREGLDFVYRVCLGKYSENRIDLDSCGSRVEATA
jgi:hypothetical protein